jgi:AraC-like DNA-binding protein
MRPSTVEQRRRLYLQARVVIARHYRRPLTHAGVARALSSSPRQLTRAFAQFGEVGFHEELSKRRLNVAAQLLIEQPAIPVRDVARLVGFRQASHFAWSFRSRYGLTPAAFRAEGRAYARGAHPTKASREPVCRASSVTRPAPRREDASASECRPQARAGR